MTAAEVQELFAFNAWANRRIFDGVAQLAVADYLRDLKSSHGGIHGTLCHIVWAEHLWLTRWLGEPKPAVAQGKDLASLTQVRARWEEVEAERGRFLDRKSTRLNSSHRCISYAVFCLKKKTHK